MIGLLHFIMIYVGVLDFSIYIDSKYLQQVSDLSSLKKTNMKIDYQI